MDSIFKLFCGFTAKENRRRSVQNRAKIALIYATAFFFRIFHKSRRFLKTAFLKGFWPNLLA